MNMETPEYRDGFATGKEHQERRHYREKQDGENADWRAGYEAPWDAGFFARYPEKQLTLL